MAVARSDYSLIEDGGTYTVLSGSNRLAVFWVIGEGNSSTDTEGASLTCGGVSATLLRKQDTASSTYIGVSCFYIKEADIAANSLDTGTPTVAFAFVDDTPTNSSVICMTLTGVDQTTISDSDTGNAANTLTVELPWTLATNSSGGLGVCVAAGASNTPTYSLSTADGWTEQLDTPESTSSRVWFGDKALTGSSTTAGITPSASNSTSLVAVAFRPAGAALVKKMKVSTHPSAASATGVEGVVYAAAGISGTEVGEFTGKTFEATTEGVDDDERAILKVPVADFGGGSLAVDDTVYTVVRNATHTTGIIPATIIEE